MKSYRSRWVPNATTVVLIRDTEIETHKNMMEADIRVITSISQKIPKIAGHHQKLREAQNRFSLRASSENCDSTLIWDF